MKKTSLTHPIRIDHATPRNASGRIGMTFCPGKIKRHAFSGGDWERDLDIDLIDRINPFGEAYAILAKTMSEESLKRVAAVISAKKVNLTPDEARDLANRALKFKQERGRLPSITSMDAWEKRMAEGVAFLARMKAEAANG